MARKTTTVDYLWGKNIGEGAFARVVHAKRKIQEGAGVEVIRSEDGTREPASVVAVSGDSPSRSIEVRFADNTTASITENRVFPDHLAVKLMEKAHIIKNDKVEYVKQEKTFLAKLSGSAWIIRLLASFQDKDNVYMVMPLAHGGMLHGLIQKRREENLALPSPQVDVAFTGHTARFYLAEMVCALRFLHGRNIVHRDLKPENILVMADGHLKLTDFGTALDVAAGDGVKDFVGTPEFVSPEVLKDEPATAAADMWGLGVIIFQLLSGRVPFTAASEWLIFQVILEHCSGEKTVECPPNVADAHAFAQSFAGVSSAPETAEASSSSPPPPPPPAATSSPAPGSTGELVLGLLRQDIGERWTLDQVISHPFLAPLRNAPGAAAAAAGAEETKETAAIVDDSATSTEETVLEDSVLLGMAPPWVPGQNVALVEGDECVEFSNDWLFEQEDDDVTTAEALPLESLHPTAPSAAAAEEGPPEESTRGAAASSPTGEQAAGPAGGSGGGKFTEPDGASEWRHLMQGGEKIVYMGLTRKRKGLFSKLRLLILTDKPRLVYIDPDTKEVKGEVPWTTAQPVSVAVIDSKHFDMVSPADNERAYHFMTMEEGRHPSGWAKAVDAVLAAKNNNPRPAVPRPKSAMTLFGGIVEN